MSFEQDSSIALKIFPAPFRDYVSPRARKIIFWSVVSIHIAIIVLPLLWFALITMLAPPRLKVTRVGLVPDPATWPIPSQNPSSKRPDPSAQVPDPGPLDPLPPDPASAPDPTPEPAPAPTPAPKSPTKPTPKDPVKTPDKPKAATKTAKDDKKSVEKPKAKSIEEQLKESQKNVKTTGAGKGKSKPFHGGGNPDLDAAIRNIKTGAPAGGGGGNPGEVGDSMDDAYFQRIQSHVYNLWHPPARALTGDVRPVEVKISVAANGQVLSATIVNKSGNQLMDASAERLLADMKVLPVPPRALEFSIKLVIPN